MSLKVVGVILVSLVVAFGAGWLTGAAGRTAAERTAMRTAMRAEAAEARALVLDGRVSLYMSNFGDAIARFQDARRLVGRLQIELRDLGQTNQVAGLDGVLTKLTEAQEAAAAFDPTAQTAAADATRMLDVVREGGPSSTGPQP